MEFLKVDVRKNKDLINIEVDIMLDNSIIISSASYRTTMNIAYNPQINVYPYSQVLRNQDVIIKI